MQEAHDLALFTLTAGCAVAALLIADAAEESARGVPLVERRRAMLLAPQSRIPSWTRPATLRLVSLAFLSGMAASGAILVGAFP